MMKNNSKRFLAVLLTICMLFSTFIGPVAYATDTDGCTCGAEDGNHTEDCALYEEPTCTCTPVDGVHQEGCALYEEPTCSCTPVDGVHQEGCALYVAPTCSCTPVDGVHQEGCALYEEPTCSCTPVDGVHQEGCALYVAPTCSCTPVDGVHQEGCALYVAPTCSCTPVDGVHQEGCALYVASTNLLTTDTSDSTISFSAVMYKDADRTQKAVELTSAGSTLTDWEYLSESKTTAARFLAIDLENLDDTKEYQVVVEMEPILYINEEKYPTLEGTTVSYVKNGTLTVNTNGTYTPNEKSFSNLTYLLGKDCTGLRISLQLGFDFYLWNKQNGGNLGDGTNALLHVYLQEKQTDGTFETVTNCDVSLLQATVSGAVSGNGAQLYTYLKGDSSNTNISSMSVEDTLRVLSYRFDTNAYNLGHYAENIKVQITIPTCEIDGTTYRMNYENFKFLTSSGSIAHVESFDESAGILTVTAENLYLSKSQLFEVYLTVPDALKSITGKHAFKGSITVIENGVSVISNKTLSFTVDNDNQPEMKAYTQTGKADIFHPEAAHFLGTLAMRNESATTDSGPLQINLEFDTNNTNTVRVTTVNLMCDNVTETIEVKYTLIDQDGNPVTIDGETEFTTTVSNAKNLKATSTTNLYITFSRNNLPEEHQSYYFKTISYNMTNLVSNGYAYNSQGGRGTKCAGTVWGYVVADKIPSTMPKHSITVYPQDGGDPWIKTTTISTTIDSGTKVSYGLENAKVSSTSVIAGDSVKISGRVVVWEYPYVSNGCLDDICLAMVLPAGILINESSVHAAYTTGGDTLEVKSFTKKELANGNFLYVIEFDQEKTIGYYSEQLGALPAGYQVDFSFQLDSDKSISKQTINLRESLFAAGLGLENGSSAAKEGYSATDTYDLNANGSVSDNIACFGNSTTTAVTFQEAPAELSITDELTNSSGESGSSLNLTSFADVLNYNLHIECTQGGSASGFYYMIPIGKKALSASNEDTFVSACEVDLKMTGAATVTTSQGTPMKVLYSTTAISSYADTLAITDWWEELPAGTSWSDVTAIKVIADGDTIVNGSINTISVPLGYAGVDTEYASMAGYQISWSSRGYYHYQLGYNSNSGTRSTTGCTITLTYTPQETIRFTLTAAKNGETSIKDADKYELDLGVLFYLAQEYRVKQITPTNVTLVDADYDFKKATSVEANQNFRINISVKNKGDATGSKPIALQKDNDLIGKLAEKSTPVFTFSIENADALSDIVTERKVTLTLIGDNGVIVPVEITILRELATAEPTESAIVAGEQYSPFNGTADPISVSRDSAFTAQFVTQYIPNNYTDHTIEFAYAPVSGTTITMIDWTNSSNLKFYHYTLDGNTTSVKLTSFQGMGSSSAFTESTDTSVVTERLLFIVSFPEGGETIRTNTLKLTKTFKGNSDTDEDSTTEQEAVLQFTTVAQRTFDLTPQETSVKHKETFTLNYTSACNVTDSRYTGRYLSLVVSPDENTNFPVDACLTVNGTNYYLNGQGKFVVPLTAVQAGNGEVTCTYASASDTSVTLNAELWASATANGAKPFMGNKVAGPVTISVTGNTEPSFKVTGMTARVLDKDDLSGTITVTFNKQDAEKVTVELQKEESAGYVTQTALLESVNGATTAAQGVFSVSGTSASLKLSASTEKGTYRLLFKASNGNVTIEVPYNFVVVD